MPPDTLYDSGEGALRLWSHPLRSQRKTLTILRKKTDPKCDILIHSRQMKKSLMQTSALMNIEEFVVIFKRIFIK